MKTLTTTRTLPTRINSHAALQAKRIGIALFALAITALEGWLRFPIQPVIDSYLRSSVTRISAMASSGFCVRSF